MNKEENPKILYKITAYDSDFVKETPDKVRTIGGTINYYYDFKKHRYLSQFVSDDFDIYDEFKRLIEENTHLQKENQQLKEEIKGYQQMYFDKVMIINKAIGHINACGCELSKDETRYLLEILKGEENDKDKR